MTLQTDLQDAVARVQSDSQVLHNIVHGDDQTVVPTEGGNVKSVAKAIKDIEDTIQQGLNDLGAAGEQLAEAVADAEESRDQAAEHAHTAQTLADALNLPTDLIGKAGMLLAVKEDESGYEPIESKGVFYGLRKDGAKLLAESGDGTFAAKDYPVWFITLPGVDFSIGPDGHLLINI
ncbi:hypothetical protein [Micavibrio aeruginosavorus]|uniref:Uncharacterized protein n=1 Tax=Micavibrio aeruginosavorus EPB TaxID=349215 RepID=M4VHR0_9BACT|nr:hypothetical protein [Micavibrio aeruginosavorus]AGH98937.1 hypothetical protein A11S_2139 [Micavibrio aeruginosavorus EPB]